MRIVEIKKRVLSIACLVSAILFLTANQASAQIRIGPVNVNVPELSKPLRDEKPTSTVRASRETSAKKGTESLNETSAASSPLRPQSDARLEIILEEINKRKKEVETYDPAERSELVTMSTPELFLPAISMRARANYYKRDQLNERQQAALNPALDSLAALAATKLPLFKPNAAVFAFRSSAVDSIMKQSLKNAASIKVHRSGIKESVWLIEKNELGIPLDRYKHGYIWARDNSDDHPYCHFYTIHVQQNYAGGGTYGAVFARLSDDVIVGCP